MKQISLFLIAAATLLGGCNNKPSNAYTVQGTLDPAFDGKKVYVIPYDSRKATDSTVVANGKFAFEGVADSAYMATILLGREKQALVVVEAGQPIDVDFEAGSAKLPSSPLNEALAKIDKDLNALAADSTVEDEAFIQAYKDIYLAHSNDAIGLMALRNSAFDATTQQMDEMIAKAGPLLLSFDGTKEVIKGNETLKKTAEGMPFTDFTITQEDGTTKSLSDFVGKGKYVLVDFWASWCGPCIRETPVIKEVYNKYKGKNFDVLGVAVWDKPADTKVAIEKHQIPWSQILNAQSIATEAYGINGIPHIILFAPDGKILARGLRDQHLKEVVAEAMGK